MYCKNCGALLNDRYVVCILCRKGKGKGNRYCAFCGEELDHPGAERCEKCGKLTGPEDPKKPITPDMLRFEPGFALVLSLIIPGMGQAMNYQFFKGILLFIAYVFLNGLTAGPKYALVIQAVYAVAAAADAFCVARRLKNGESVSRWQFF